MLMPQGRPSTLPKFDVVEGGWNNLGEINDVMMTRNGMVPALMLDTGEFLGVGKRQVAVKMSDIRFANDASTADDENDFFLVMTVAQAELESAPEYMMGDTSMGTNSVTTDAATTDIRVDGGAVIGIAMEGTMCDGYLMAEADDLTSDKLTRAEVYDAEDDDLGPISDLILIDDGQITQAVNEVGGFLGIGVKPLALSLTDIDILRNQAGDELRVYPHQTREELDAMLIYEG